MVIGGVMAASLLVNMSLDLATRLRNTTMQAAARHRNTLPGQLVDAAA